MLGKPMRAVCPPSGGNVQRWRFLVTRDPKVTKAVAALYKRAWDEQVEKIQLLGSVYSQKI